MLQRWTPYSFLREMENVLAPPLPQTSGREPRAQGPRDLPHVNWTKLIKKGVKAMTGTLHVIESKEMGEQQQKNRILDNLETYIHNRQHELATSLMQKRNDTVQGWKDKLPKPDQLD